MHGRLNTLALALAFTAAALLPGRTAAQGAGDSPSVLELYTSQGCSSCPPADALMEKFAARRDVIALSLPVDYWDYLGWKDTLATPANTARQQSYARARGDGQVYTPQMVIDGIRHVVGSQKDAIERALIKTRQVLSKKRVPLKMRVEGETLVIEAGAAPEGSEPVKPATIWLAKVRKSEVVDVRRGENRGRKLTYYNVVKQLTPVGQWTGRPVTLRLPRQHVLTHPGDACTVLLQQDMAGPILAATQMSHP